MSLNIGDVVFYKTHPYTANNNNIKIAMYADYTAPILVVFKSLEDREFDATTGKKVGMMTECVYYSTNEGKFCTRKIHSSELISSSESVGKDRTDILNKINIGIELDDLKKEKNIKSIEELIKSKYLHAKVTLRSVDLELHKCKVGREKDNGDLVETNHLEFLPPVMTVIDFRYCDDKNKFCNKTGKPLIEFKCKWYNSKLKTFSEEFLNTELLYLIDFPLHLLEVYGTQIDSNSYNLIKLKKSILLEDSANKEVQYTLGQSEAIVHKHYYYDLLTSDLIKGKKVSVLINDEIKEIKDSVLWGSMFPDYKNKRYFNGINDYDFKENEYYYISYTDKAKRFSKRVVKIRDIFFVIENREALYESLGWVDDKISGNDSNIKEFISGTNLFFINSLTRENVSISKDKNGEEISVSRRFINNKNVVVLLETNCLLKGGLIRHFRLDGISEVRMINNGISLLEEGEIIIDKKE
jgi:hypothetical protein